MSSLLFLFTFTWQVSITRSSHPRCRDFKLLQIGDMEPERPPPSSVLIHPRRRRNTPPNSALLQPIRVQREQIEDLQKRYRQSDAALFLGISLTAMKNACRKLRLGPWPCSRTSGDKEEEDRDQRAGSRAGVYDHDDDDEEEEDEDEEEVVEEDWGDDKGEEKDEAGRRRQGQRSQSAGKHQRMNVSSELFQEALDHVSRDISCHNR
eukprot:750154-Hanusia_phi.AAC.5